MGLEMLSIALALSTWAALLHRRKAVIFSDNTGAEESSVRRAPPRAPAERARAAALANPASVKNRICGWKSN